MQGKPLAAAVRCPGMPSTAIRTLSYDEETRTLFVTFNDGDVYAYFETPPQVYAAFRAADSKGGFFAREIRGRYRYQQVPRGISA